MLVTKDKHAQNTRSFFTSLTTNGYNKSNSHDYCFLRDQMRARFPIRSPDLKTGFCFGHSKFGNRAYKCSKPCKFDKSLAKSINAIESTVNVEKGSTINKQ